MKTNIIASSQMAVPVTSEPINLDESIIIQDEHGAEIIIGEAAVKYSPEGVKRRGGQPKQGSWRNFLKAAIAHTLGAGNYKKTIAFSTPESQMKFFRGDVKGVKIVTPENYEIIKDTVREIKFKHVLEEEWKICELEIPESPIVNYETVAVARAIPQKYQTYLLWQLGFGDWQQLAIVDNQPEPTSMSLLQGVSGAFSLFEQRTQLSKSNVKRAWENGFIPEKNSYNGKKEDATQIIYQCLRSYFHTNIGPHLNKVDQFRDRISHVILSGGSSKDNKVCEVIGEEIGAEELKLIPIAKIMKAEDLKIKDPIYSTVLGLCSQADIGIDIGNSFIKTGEI